MDAMQAVYLLLIFVAVTAVALAVMYQLRPQPVQERLEKIAAGATAEKTEKIDKAEAGGWVHRFVKLSGPLAKLSVPVEGWEGSHWRIRFINAGYRDPSAPLVYFAAKTILTFLLPGLLLLYAGIIGGEVKHNVFLMLVLGAAALGYFLPNFFLAWRIFLRKREIFENFPDAIDLMTVCVEAGLGLDAALARVGSEMRLKSQTLADEMHLVSLEMRAGGTRERALRNLALRTGVEEVDGLVVMLVQADRFGTSVADSLRIHSDSLRTKRRLRAEEKAAKIATKLLFPLIFFIFPSMLLVLLGPAFISIYRTLLTTFSGWQ